MCATPVSTAVGAVPGRKFGDWLFFNLTRTFAALTLLLLAGIVVSLFVGSWESIQKFGFSFIWRKD